ncbi:hypothetical protein LZ480_19525 [Solibacillus sp. MA9]|uniref:DUF4367 domain-containing protein n=1 Tax=Solibacillus palustris TaxID=2908203 RepID=A0ABS9UIY7_9BACL|nr:hypothetical protein [Solibacillus sp. MA9]MCH7324054.1 hypothetical protein [Solibacillus sp. MA9]
MKKILTILMAFTLVFLVIQPVMATLDIVKIGSEFVIALTKKDEEQARTYLASDVDIPEIREDTPIRKVTGLPSPKENISVTIAYFDDDENYLQGRIAFIWEITFKKEKITDIRVVYDGSNPFMNESKAIKEYEAKNKTNIRPPSKFPFDITHIDGYVDEDVLMLRYRSAGLGGLLQIKVVPHNTDLETLKGENDEFYSLKNGTNALYQPNFPLASQLIFQNGNSRYSISISYSTKENVTVDDLLKVANSMFFN